mgnify:FL=1
MTTYAIGRAGVTGPGTGGSELPVPGRNFRVLREVLPTPRLTRELPGDGNSSPPAGWREIGQGQS